MATSFISADSFVSGWLWSNTFMKQTETLYLYIQSFSYCFYIRNIKAKFVDEFDPLNPFEMTAN